MNDQPVALDLVIHLDHDEVFRALGYRDNARRSARVERRLAELWPSATGLLRPRGCYRVLDGVRAASTGMPTPSARVAVALCTVGRELEDESHHCSAAGNVLDALLCDAIGSAAAESAADTLNAELCGIGRAAGLHTTPRVSPGYGEWETACQGEFLALLPAAELGVTLTSGLMMVPRKSVSFAVNLESGVRPNASSESACGRCGRPSCMYRRD
jgi:Vitamin B12 dependent methionine synthase, activation domain